MRLHLTRTRLIVAFIVFLALFALVLGIVFPPERSAAGGAAAAPSAARLLVTEYGPAQSTLWAVSPQDPRTRSPLLLLPHADGWEVEGTVAPDGGRVAFLSVPPDGHDPTSQAALSLFDGTALQPLARGLDLRGGLVWTQDGAALLARRSRIDERGLPTFAIVEIDARDGTERTHIERSDVLGLYPVGRPTNGPLYVAAISIVGSELIAIPEEDAHRSVPISPAVTRDWTLSPDGARLAFTEQRGLRLQVLTLTLTEAAAPIVAAEIGIATGSASPLWHPDGTLSVGTFGAPEASPVLRVQAQTAALPPRGFALPAAWSPDGRSLAVRAFSGAGPGAVGDESAGILGADGALRLIPGALLRVVGWWSGAG